ncbi:MAG: hypothetical protein HZB10_00140 [Candidatus Yonathbacteria bacterium]|nr:hypothetical protein [Candidatus Yonathbacteria bacterium]
MLTTEDIQKLTSILATKEDFNGVKSDVASLKTDLKDFKDKTEREFISLKTDIKEIKEDVAGLRESLQGMIVAVDNLTKVITDLRMEYTAITYQLKRHEDWIKQIAEKAGVNLVL